MGLACGEQRNRRRSSLHPGFALDRQMLGVVSGWCGPRFLSRMCFAVCRRPPSCGGCCSRLVRLCRAMERRGMVTSEPLGRGGEDGLVEPAEFLPALPGPRGRTVTGGSRDESSGPRLMPLLLIKMINKSRGKILGVLALFLVMVWYSIYREDRYIQLFYFPVQENKTMCPLGEVEKKAAQLIGNYTRDHPLFLQLKDYFWVKTPSLYELPYGTKGSEDVLLRLLSITHYSLPESIQSLKCRRCAVVGNGHRLRNSSMGETINTYDVVIRLNNAPVHGYEQDVGSKTTMRLFYPESAHFNPRTENNPDTLLVLVPFKPMDFQWMEAILNDKKRVRKGFWKQPPLIWDANPERVRILNPYYMEVTAAKLLNLPMKQPRKVKQKPTTGLLAITLALHFCDLVHIAGFGYPDSANKKQTIHYYEQITLKSMAASEHNVSHEAVAIKRMLELGLVKNLTYF
ncbi:CMP-N-acetylneuraminate-beta-galactosamide-alpha-2,3-sialyltransferase 4 isoform X4 [Grus americana]|uniref:CMP-N-acetylneuraminate-beta-galactosamide- alpha-2,3-sialyltransferase 4 isoform X4 n=1 Tax=Grus americana TaxID=9117 RepID=UPI00240803F2|nr:CMP-N-acetylneuraminate-beta-galactosamide-alpha-2,3-sialyltransferase 4 isoform X4 [Grus americana]